MTRDDRLIERYLAEVDGHLPGPRRLRRDVIDELRDGLLEAAESDHGRSGPRDACLAAVDGFGPPAAIAGALADELRLRLARRSGLTMLATLAVTHLVWQLYAALVGFPRSTVPEGRTAPVFLAAVDVVRAAPTVALAGGVVLVVAASMRRADGWVRWLTVATAVTVAATALTLAALVIGSVTISEVHQPATLAAGLPTAGALITTLLFAHSAHRHVRDVGRATGQPASATG